MALGFRSVGLPIHPFANGIRVQPGIRYQNPKSKRDWGFRPESVFGVSNPKESGFGIPIGIQLFSGAVEVRPKIRSGSQIHFWIRAPTEYQELLEPFLQRVPPGCTTFRRRNPFLRQYCMFAFSDHNAQKGWDFDVAGLLGRTQLPIHTLLVFEVFY